MSFLKDRNVSVYQIKNVYMYVMERLPVCRSRPLNDIIVYIIFK